METIIPKVRLFPPAKLRACKLGWYFSSSIALTTRARVEVLTTLALLSGRLSRARAQSLPGTQELPASGRDIQDEKILGTLHVATGRSDHLGGALTPDRFANSLIRLYDEIKQRQLV